MQEKTNRMEQKIRDSYGYLFEEDLIQEIIKNSEKNPEIFTNKKNANFLVGVFVFNKCKFRFYGF